MEAKQALLKALELSATHPYWHCRLAFQIAVSQSLLIYELRENKAFLPCSFLTKQSFFFSFCCRVYCPLKRTMTLQ